LVSDITKYPGQVHFAVRFFIEDETTKGKFHYLLNTQTAILNVKDSLNVIDPKHEYENDINEFKRFVSNSANPAYTIPVSPFFTDVNGGQDLPKYAAIKDTNTLKLEAQAVASDLGDITYKWFYVPAGSNLKEEIVGGDGIYEVKLYEYVKVDLIVDEEGKVTNSKGLDKYWVKTGSDEAESYELYTGEWPPAADAELYEIITSLTFEDKDIDIVGEYWVEAVNTIVKNSTNPVSSTHCIVPAPKAIEYTKNLTKHIFIDAKTGKATLSITIVPDGNNPKIEYHWFSNTEGEKAEYSEIVGVDKNSYDVTEAGWYRVEPKSTLNRKVETNPSVICKVTELPEKPVITELAYKLHSASDYNILAEDADMGDRWTMGSLIDLRVKTNLDEEDEENSLLTEGLNYQWYMQNADTATVHPLTEKDIDDNGLLLAGTDPYSKEITVRCVNDGVAYAYYCVITNEIAKVKSEAISSAEYNSFIIK
jgi:hypothetical protein